MKHPLDDIIFTSESEALERLIMAVLETLDSPDNTIVNEDRALLLEMVDAAEDVLYGGEADAEEI